jgi:hypothetical protein
MKIIIGILTGVFITFLLFRRYYVQSTPTSVPSGAIPATLQGFYAAVATGQITFVMSDPMGIYAADGSTKIGYWTADGSVYNIKGTLIDKGMGGISNLNKLTF